MLRTILAILLCLFMVGGAMFLHIRKKNKK